MSDVLNDLASLADTLGAQVFRVLVDERTHPSESLMHPGLAEVQGPALVACIDGCRLSSEEIAQLIAPPSILPVIQSDNNSSSSSSHNGNAPSSANLSASSSLHGGKKRHPYPNSGKRLMSAFAVTDCLQVRHIIYIHRYMYKCLFSTNP